MDKLLNNKIKPSLVGLVQGLAVVIYSAAVAGFFYFMGQTKIEPGYFGIVLMLVLLVFSAGVTGTFVFGIPAYFALTNDIKRAISILAYTFLYILLAIVLTVIIIFVIF